MQMTHGFPPFILRCIFIIVALWIIRRLIHFTLPRLARIKIPRSDRDRILMRYQQKDFGAWMFAWFKTGLDPMFDELPQILNPITSIRNFLDLGCGFGIAGCFVLDRYPEAIAYAVDPTPHRVRGAAAAMGDRGHVFIASAPDFEMPEFPDHFDAIFALDMIHFLSDANLDLTLSRCHAKLKQGQHLVIRSPIRPDGPLPFRRRCSYLFSKLTGTYTTLRTTQQVGERINHAHFHITACKPSGNKPDLVWFIATASPVQNVDHNPDDHQQHNHRVNHNHRSPVPSGELV